MKRTIINNRSCTNHFAGTSTSATPRRFLALYSILIVGNPVLGNVRAGEIDVVRAKRNVRDIFGKLIDLLIAGRIDPFMYQAAQ